MTKFDSKNNPGKGRPKGAKNKATVMRAEEVMASLKFNPTTEMIRQVLAEETPLDIKAKLAIELNALINPKAKAAEAPEQPEESETPTGKPNLTVVTNLELTELLKKPNDT